MADCEAIPEGPAWMLALEKKRLKVHRLAHEVGAGSPCLLCKEACPGLDLHFWRKICRNCKCKKEDHEVVDDCGFEQFEILLGSGHSRNHTKKAFLEFLEKQTSAAAAAAAGKVRRVAFDWVPPNVSLDLAAEYMQALPPSKLPVSGSDGALYRRQQLERQLPLHDLDASQCHQLTDKEVENLKKYLENLQNNVVGQGRISKLIIPTSKSVDTLQSLRSFNAFPKPFHVESNESPWSSSSFSGPAQLTTIGDKPNTAHNLKFPSAFLQRTASPDLPIMKNQEDILPSVADRGAMFGVALSPSSRRGRGKEKSMNPDSHTPSKSADHVKNSNSSVLASDTSSAPNLGTAEPAPPSLNNLGGLSNSSSLVQIELGSQVVRSSTPKQLVHSGNVPGNMWVPEECEECSQGRINGRIVSDKICTHVSQSDIAPHNFQFPQVPLAGHSSGIRHTSAPAYHPKNFSENLDSGLSPEVQKKTFEPQPIDGYLSIIGSNSQIAPSKSYPTGTSFVSSLIPVKSHEYSQMPVNSSGRHDVSEPMPEKTQADLTSQSDSDVNTFEKMLCDDKLLSMNPEYKPHFPVGNVYSLGMEQSPLLNSANVFQSKPQLSGMISSTEAPPVMALYAHNALHSPSALEPQDRLSPHLASLNLDEVASNTKHAESDPDRQFTVQTASKFNCTHCHEDILPGEVVVWAERAGPGIVWHPKCFVCTTCQELLVDLVYFFSKGLVYCGRHFAELLDIPRCSACDELIFVKQHTVAEGQAFHVKHFCCFECDEALAGKQYIPKDGQPICLPCCELKYGKTCETCHNAIRAKDKRVTWKNLHWHAAQDCFYCVSCHCSLLGRRLAVKEQRPFCSQECIQSFYKPLQESAL